MTAVRPRAPLAVRCLATLTLAVLFAPLVIILTLSFVAAPTGGPMDLAAPSFYWYEKLFASTALGHALLRSLIIAVATSTAATILGTLGALALERGRFRGRGILEALVAMPLALPELALGIASVLWFTTLRMTLGLHSIVLAHITFTLSYVVITIRSRLAELDPSLEEAARDLGASPTTAFRRVTLPLLIPGIVGGWMMACTLSFDDFLISFFTAGVGGDTLPMKLYGMIRFGLNKEMYALSALLVSATVAGLIVHRFTAGATPGMLPSTVDRKDSRKSARPGP